MEKPQKTHRLRKLIHQSPRKQQAWNTLMNYKQMHLRSSWPQITFEQTLSKLYRRSHRIPDFEFIMIVRRLLNLLEDTTAAIELYEKRFEMIQLDLHALQQKNKK